MSPMKNIKKIAVCFLLTLTMSVSSEARDFAFRVGAHVGGAYHHTTMEGSIFQGLSTKARRGLIMGVYGDVSLPSLIGAEMGFDVQERNYTILDPTDGNSDFSYMVLMPHATFGLRLPFLSVGIGPYLAVSMGTVDVVSGGVSRTRTMTDVGLRYADVGGLLNARGSVPLPGSVSVTGELRYLYGLTDLTQSDLTVSKTREWQFLLGAEIAF